MTASQSAAPSRTVMEDGDIARAMRRISHEIVERNPTLDEVLIVGIHTRGAPLAARIGTTIADIDGTSGVAVGELDIGMYRDDLDTRPTTPLGHTDLPVELAGHTVVLVDDVLYTGRTIRAALDALADLGRPGSVQLAVLVDRGHRELPIRADYVGKNLPTSASERVMVRLEEIDGIDQVTIEDQSAATSGTVT